MKSCVACCLRQLLREVHSLLLDLSSEVLGWRFPCTTHVWHEESEASMGPQGLCEGYIPSVNGALP